MVKEILIKAGQPKIRRDPQTQPRLNVCMHAVRFDSAIKNIREKQFAD
jgi:hypothetical protein